MLIGFVIWTFVAAVMFGIGIGCMRSRKTVGFFTFAGALIVKDVKAYNKAVAVLWLVMAIVLETLGIPLLYLKQNSPWIILIILAVMLLVLMMIVFYMRIEAKYRV